MTGIRAAVASVALAAATAGGGVAWATQQGSPGACPPSESTTILGDTSLSADDLRSWWTSTGRGQPAGLHAPIGDVIGDYVAEGEAEGVRGDLAFAQAVLETGYFKNGDTRINNFAGIAHYDDIAYGSAFRSPQDGVRAQVQLLKKYAAGNGVGLAHLDVSPRVGAASATWAGLAGTWASSPAYWSSLSSVYASMCAGHEASQRGASSRLVAAAEAWVGRDFHPGVPAQCAYFVRQVLADAGLDVGVTTQTLDGYGTTSEGAADSFGADQGEVIRDVADLRPGDVVMFADTYGNWPAGTITHVGLYVGDGDMVDRGTYAMPVTRRPVSTFPHFAGAVRLAAVAPTRQVSLPAAAAPSTTTTVPQSKLATAADRLFDDALNGWGRVGDAVHQPGTPRLGQLYDDLDGAVRRYTGQ